MVVGESKRTNIMDGIENTGDVRLHDHRLRLKQRFDIVRKLGQGTYGKVQLGINKKTGQEVAIKTIKKCKIESEADLIRIRREVQIMSSVRHPNIVHIYEVFENSEKMILVMEYCSGGELYDYLSQKKVFEEDEARRLFRQIATAVYYCHIHKICHRDLKLENVLLDETGSAKIADFGLSNVFKETSLLSTFCGSPLYASPEIVKGTPYIGPEVDCWSLGVLLYTLVYGAMPFDGSNFKRLVRQISNGDYYEPKSPSTASPLIRDMLTVDPLKRADIAYICDHPWVNTGCETSCLEMAQALAAETPVRLDLLLSLAPVAPSHSNSVLVPPQPAEMGADDSCTDLTSSTSMAVEPSNSAEKRILELVAEGGEDAIKPSPTRTIVSAGDNKRKLQASSSSLLDRKRDRLPSCASIAPSVPEEAAPELDDDEYMPDQPSTPPTLKSSATITIQPSPPPPLELVRDPTREIKEPQAAKEPPKEAPHSPKEEDKTGARPRIGNKKITPTTSLEDQSPEKDEPKQEEAKPSSVATAADRLTSLSLTQPAPKPKKLSFPGGSVGSFKEQFERRASLTAAPEAKRGGAKPALSRIAKPKAQSEDRDLPAKSASVRLQQIGIEPSQAGIDEHHRGGVKKTESEPTHSTTAVDPSSLLNDARRSLQNSMAKLVEEKQGEDRRRARDIISSAIRTGMSMSADRGKPPMPYGRSASAGVATLASPPSTPSTPQPAPAPTPRVFRTEAKHRVDDHRNRGTSVERIIPINLSPEEGPASPPPAPSKPAPATTQPKHTPLRRLLSNESSTSDPCGSPGGSGSGVGGEPIKKSAREFIIPIAVEGKGYVTPRQRSLEPETAAATAVPPAPRLSRTTKPRRISLVSGGESEEEDDSHMHRLRSSRAARAESVSSGEEDEEDEGFHLLTAENLFSTLLHRVRALTNRLNGEEGPGFPQNPHSLFNNLHQSPFFNSPHLPRRSLLREGWGSRNLHSDFDSMFNKTRTPMPRGNGKGGKGKGGKSDAARGRAGEAAVGGEGREAGLDLSDLDLSGMQLSEREMAALSGLTPALSRRLQLQLLASLPPAAARSLRRTLSLNTDTRPSHHHTHQQPAQRSHSATNTDQQGAAAATQPAPAPAPTDTEPPTDTAPPPPKPVECTIPTPTTDETTLPAPKTFESTLPAPRTITEHVLKEEMELPAPQWCTLPRLKRHATRSRECTPPTPAPAATAMDALDTPRAGSRAGSLRSTPERPLLSKYLTPERHIPALEEPYPSDSGGGGTILSEPSYIAAYGTPALRRHSLRVAGEQPQPRKRISRFLRSDFFDTPPDESVYAKHKKEKELETQKILKEIREKRNKSSESQSVRSSTEPSDVTSYKDDTYTRKCLSPISPISILTGKERSRSNTPFFPILDNIKEATLDSSLTSSDTKRYTKSDEIKQKYLTEDASNDTKLIRPKSYPVKDSSAEPRENSAVDNASNKDHEVKDKCMTKESKLIRPKSYPTSSPSPEKVFINRNLKKDDTEVNTEKDDAKSADTKTDVEVSFNVTLPTKSPRTGGVSKVDTLRKSKSLDKENTTLERNKKPAEGALTIKKYQVVSSHVDKTPEIKERKPENGCAMANGSSAELTTKTTNSEAKTKVVNETTKADEPKVKSTETEPNDKKGTIKKKIIRKVSKSKADSATAQDGTDGKPSTEKKKITKKVKKDDKSPEDGTKTTTVKKKSMLQSIGHKLEKLASNKSSSPEKASESSGSEAKSGKWSRAQREQSVPVHPDPPTESNLIQRAATVTDVAALDAQHTTPNKTTVSKVLGLFRKFEPKEKLTKQSSIEKSVEKTPSIILETADTNGKSEISSESTLDFESDKPKRPTSLLLNGLGRKTKYGRSASDTVSPAHGDDDMDINKKDTSKNIKSSLKLDFSRLPRVKKIVPTNPVIEPQIMNVSSDYNEKKDIEKNGTLTEDTLKSYTSDSLSRSRSRSRSSFSNSEIKSENSTEAKYLDRSPLYTSEHSTHHPVRNHESTTPDKEDIVDRIRRKSFYSRFNEKKHRRKSSLVGPGASEYDPVARIHGPPAETRSDSLPVSPTGYDLSPGYSVASDLSPSTDRYRSLIPDLPLTTRNNLRFDNYGLNDKVDTYRSLDRNEFRKYPSTRSYHDYDPPSYSHRYARTKSLLDSGSAPPPGPLPRDPQKYNRTISMYAPGSYATYRPKRTRNPAIILKESEKEPSPENILEKIRNRKNFSISVTRKPDLDKDHLPRSDVPPQGQGDGTERAAQAD